jgi:ribokinase
MAPAAPVPKEVLEKLDILIVNRIEAKQIAEKLNLKIEEDAIKLARVLSETCALTCVVTLGPKGSVAVEKDGLAWQVDAMVIEDVADTTGAGDAYCGAFAAAIHNKQSVPEAMRYGSVAGSLACRGKGAQASVAFKEELEDNLPNVPEARKM